MDQSSDTSNFIIKIVFVILAIVVLIRRHPEFIDWLKGLTGGSFVGAVAGQTNFGVCEGGQKPVHGVPGMNVLLQVKKLVGT